MAKQNFDALGNEIQLTKNDFTFVQRDETIFDTKFETKPTTFIKDAFKRFCKNKSSVVGAFIIGIIMLFSIIVPMVSPYSLDGVTTNREKFMLPKLFESGTGFWDGTEKVKGVSCIYDEDTDRWMPYGFESKSESCYEIINKYEKDGVWYCDYVYDKYEDYYGEQIQKNFSKLKIQTYVNAGYCNFTLDYEDVNGDGKYKKADGDITVWTFELTELGEELCPVREIIDFDYRQGGTVKVVKYYEYGYTEMPKYLFGTDALGRDLVTLSLKSLRTSLVFALFISAVCFIFGLIWGSISGYFGGAVDLAMERFCDILGGIPSIVIITLMRLHLGDALWVFALSLCLTGWMGTAARTRTQFYRFKGREYVLASRTLGASDTRLIFKHILPNSLGTIVTSTVLMIPGIIFTESSLSYLGLGLQGSNSFGDILAKNQAYIQIYPMLIIFPAVIISLLMISFNLFGNGLRDALNPSLKGSE